MGQLAERQPSRQNLNRRRRRTGFVGRQGELGVFRDNLSRDPADDAFQYLFHVHGQAGVGKTSMVRQWEALAREAGALTAYLDDDVHSVIEAMEAISAQFERQGVALKGFKKLLAAYRQRRHEAESPLTVAGVGCAQDAGGGASPTASPSSTIAAQAGLAGLGMVPGMGAVAGAMDPQQLAQGADRIRASLSGRFRNHADVQLVLSPVRMLTPVFMDDLAEAAARSPRVVLFFDVFERTSPVLNEWLRDILVGEEYPGLPVNVLAVLSGQGRLDARCWGDHLDLVADIPLAVFTEEEARQLLAARGVTHEETIQVILHLTGRLPVLVDTLALNRPQEPGEVADPSETAVERFLKWVSTPEQRAAAQACALPLQMDEDIYRETVPEALADQYGWLRGLPFVTGQAGRCRYHDVVRAAMLRLQRTQSPTRWQQQHTRLADIHRRRGQALQATLAPNDGWPHSAWREHRLNETYHRLCARPDLALPDALHDLVRACDAGTAVLRRWVHMVVQAGKDSADERLASWGDRLAAAFAEPADDLVSALSLVLAAPELPAEDRTLAHMLRGRQHRRSGEYEAALTDYARALALTPDFARALYGRGETLRLMGRYDRALHSLSRALDVEPDDPWSILARGQTYEAMGRYDDALADFSRLKESDDDVGWCALFHRGDTYRSMGRYTEALADCDEAIGRKPDDAWAVVRRGMVYQAMGRVEEALADYDHAAEQQATRAWACTVRAQIHRSARRFEAALADHDRAGEAEPHDAWVIGNRAETYQAMGRYDDALADHDRAIELDPEGAWVIANRGDTYRAMGRYEEAGADYDSAVRFQPEEPWHLVRRGWAHEGMGRCDDALADYDRAIEMAPAQAWMWAVRAQFLQRVGRYEDALADDDRAIELDPGNASVLSSRAYVFRLLRRYEDALADYDRVIALDPTDEWAFVGRGEAYRALGRYEEAVADYDHAIEVDPEEPWRLSKRALAYRALGRYEDALADCYHVLRIRPDNAWYHLECAVVLRLLRRRPEAGDHIRRAVEIYSDEADGEGPAAAHARGNLLVVHCAADAWGEAAAELERFLACGPRRRRIREALDDLKDLQGVLPMDHQQMEPIRRRLEGAVTLP